MFQDPTNAGDRRQGLPVTGPGVPSASPPSIIDRLSPTQIYFGEHLARSVGKANESADYLPLFGQGMTPEIIFRKEKESELAMEAAQTVQGIKSFVEQNEDLDDGKFEQAKKEWLGTAEKAPERQRAELQKLTPLEIGIALFGANANPRFAGNILAAPFEAKLGARDRDQGELDKDFEVKQREHEAKVERLGTIAQQAYRDLEYLKKRADEVLDRKLTEAEEAGKQRSISLGKAIQGILEPKAPGHARQALNEAIELGLDPERVKAYSEIADAAENKFVTDAQADADKAKADAEVKTKNWWNTLADNFNGKYNAARTTSVEITAADAAEFEADRQKLIDQGVPEALLARPKAGKTAAQVGREADDKRADTSLGIQQDYLKLAQERENRIKTNAEKPKASPTEKEKFRKVTKWNDEIEDARATWNVLSQSRPEDPNDEKAANAWQAKMDDARIKFVSARRQKDAALGIKRKEGYYETVQPDGMWGGIATPFGSSGKILPEEESIESVQGDLRGPIGNQRGKQPPKSKPTNKPKPQPTGQKKWKLVDGEWVQQ